VQFDNRFVLFIFKVNIATNAAALCKNTQQLSVSSSGKARCRLMITVLQARSLGSLTAQCQIC